MVVAGKPSPFLICLYFSVGIFGYIVARFQNNRHPGRMKNNLEYVRQGVKILVESRPPELQRHLEGVSIKCDEELFFPPRSDKGNKASNYRDVGFYNINFQAGRFHGYDRAPTCARLCSSRDPVSFNDGLLDMERMKLKTVFKTGMKVQTDKRKDMTLTYDGSPGKGIFFQYDGEARFAFSPTGEPFEIHIRKVLNIPVVLGPYLNQKLTGKVKDGPPAFFSFSGDSERQQDEVRRRIFRLLCGEVDTELIATAEDLAEFERASIAAVSGK